MKRVFGLLLLLVLAALPAFSAGLIILHDGNRWLPPRPPGIWPPPWPPPHPVPPEPPSPPAVVPLEMTLVRADVKIRDQVARTTVEQDFYNPNSRPLEGTFLFPLPTGAHIDHFSMEINGRKVHAELLKADKARAIYEEIVRQVKDPALMEFAGRDLLKVKVFPIEPRATKHITLGYTQLLKADQGLVSFTLPLNTEKYAAKPLKNVSLKLELETKQPLKSIYSPSHTVEIKRHGAHRATVGFEAGEAKPDADFQLFYAVAEGDIGLNLMTWQPPGEDGYFLLLATPGIELEEDKVIPKDVTFVLDTSGSMAGPKLEQAKKALLFCVENLQEEDRFQILRFSTEVEAAFDAMVSANPENRSRANRFIRELKPLGGTAIDEALREALELRPEAGQRPYVVVFLTDGRPTVGVTEEDQILANVTRRNDANTRVFCFGIGTDVNTHLLDKITERTRSFSQYVLPEEDIEVKVSNFFTKIKDPVLTNPKLDFPDGVRVSRTYPHPLPDLFKGEQLVVAGRFTGNGRGPLKLEGLVNGRPQRCDFAADFSNRDGQYDFIPRLWATRRVGYLLDEIRLHGENAELKDEVVDLARKYGIVTPYTAYLIVEDERRRGVALNTQTLRQFGENTRAVQESGQLYSRFRDDRSGDAAVAGAQSAQVFKEALSAAPSISAGTSYAMRPQASAGVPRSSVPGQPAATTEPAQYVQQSRFVGGRAFYQNGSQWIDAQIQNQAAASRVRVQFDTPEYYALLKKDPRVASWLALGRNVQFVLGNQIYEIYD